MAGTLTIPLTTLSPGTREFGPAVLADTDSLVTLTIDRTVTSGGTPGFDASPATTTAVLAIDQSNDGGATWTNLCTETLVGGVHTLRGQPVTTDDVGTYLLPGTSRQGRASVTVSGAPVAVQGSLTIS